MCMSIFNCVPQILYSISYFHAVFFFFSRNSAFSEMCTKMASFVSILNLFYQTCMYYCKLYCLMNIGPWKFLFLILLDLLSYLRFSVLIPLHLILAVLHSISFDWYWSSNLWCHLFKPFSVMFSPCKQYTGDFLSKKKKKKAL